MNAAFTTAIASALFAALIFTSSHPVSKTEPESNTVDCNVDTESALVMDSVMNLNSVDCNIPMVLDRNLDIASINFDDVLNFSHPQSSNNPYLIDDSFRLPKQRLISGSSMLDA